MPRLQVFAGEARRSDIDLAEGNVYAVGSAPDGAIVIDDPRVSECHCMFTQLNGRWVVEDRDSALGTFVNGQRITARVLEPGDKIALGTYTLVFGGKGKGGTHPVPKQELTLESIDLPESEVKPSPAEDLDIDLETGRKTRPMVLVLERPRRKAVPLQQQITLIGSGEHCDIRINGLLVRKEQAVVVKERGCCRIICQGGPRSVRVNGDAVREILLQAGDVITIAGYKMTFQTF